MADTNDITTNPSVTPQPKRKLIIDTDAGIDDAQAIMMALSDETVEVCAITTVRGNTDTDNVLLNVLRTLQICGRPEIPVYQGCRMNLIGNSPKDDGLYHGTDGFGDTNFNTPSDVAIDFTMVSDEHAASALVRILKESCGAVIELLCLGPLTNVAIALQLYPSLENKLKHCYIMGGSYKGRGNTTATAEFNFFADPEAAQVALNHLICPKTLVCWELCLDASLTLADYNFIHEKNTAKSNLMKRIEFNIMNNFYKDDDSKYLLADQLLVAVALDNQVNNGTAMVAHGPLVQSFTQVAVRVALSGECRGQLMVDWENLQANKEPNQWSAATIITRADVGELVKVLHKAMQ